MTPFGIAAPRQVLFGRGEAQKAPALIAAFGSRGIVVHGADAGRAAWLVEGLRAAGCVGMGVPCASEPTLEMLEAALAQVRDFGAQWVVAIGGGAALDMGKALAALIPAPGGAMDHLEVVGKGLPLIAEPLPFIALPTTAGTGAEATRNAVIAVPGRKVSLRDARMLARLAIVDPALTDGCPKAVTLASGLDAITQCVEPFVSCKATPFTDALVRPVIADGMTALIGLMAGEDAGLRDRMAWISLCGGLALANAGLGAVHGLAGVIGGVTGASHGAICGVLLGPVLAANRAAGAARVEEVCAMLGGVLGVSAQDAPVALAEWAAAAGLPGLRAQGLEGADHRAVAEAALVSSSMKGNPVGLSIAALERVLAAAR